MKKLLALAALAVMFAGGIAYERWRGHRHAGAANGEAKKPSGYHCPMHPAFRSDKPGDCGICGMKLVPDEEPGQPAAAAPAGDRKVLFYRDPNNPKYTAHTPGLNPETGAELVPVYEGDAETMPAGTIRIAPEKQQLIGVTYGVVRQESGGAAIRANGRVAADETRVARVQTRIEGWIEKVFVDFTGRLVRQGEPLLTIYSPEMLATQQEYLLALKSGGILRDSPLASLRQESGGLAEAARRRLQHFHVSDAQIAQVEKTGKPIANITLYAPAGGYVTARNAYPNQRVTPETELYTIVDLDRVWVMADIFEQDAGSIRIGQRATVTATAYPGRRWAATVAYIQPQVNPQTRTLQVRLELANPNLLLKPEMFVEVEFAPVAASRIVVPVNAVLNSGLRQTVFLDRGNGYLEPREVRTGKQFGDSIEVLEGLRPGERIVTSGTFLIDSESQLQSPGQPVAPAASAPGEPAAQPPAGTHRHD